MSISSAIDSLYRNIESEKLEIDDNLWDEEEMIEFAINYLSANILDAFDGVCEDDEDDEEPLSDEEEVKDWISSQLAQLHRE